MKKLLLLLSLLFFALCSYGQQPHLAFDHLNNMNGLPEDQVVSMVQDNMGYMWITTQAGLVRYDGYKTKVYLPGSENKNNTPTYAMMSVFIDRDHNVWVASYDNGLFKYDRRHDRFVPVLSPYLTVHEGIISALCDTIGNIWSVIETNGEKNTVLEKFEPSSGKFHRYGPAQNGKYHVALSSPFSLGLGSDKQALIKTTDNVYFYNPAKESFEVFLPQTDTSIRKKMGFPVRQLSAIHTTWAPRGNGGGLIKYDELTQKVTIYRHNAADTNSLPSDTIHGILEDGKKRIWISSVAGLSLFNPANGNFTTFHPRDQIHGQASNSLFAVSIDKKDKVWLVYRYDVFCFDTKTRRFEKYFHDDLDPTSITKAFPQKIIFDRDDKLWIAQSYGGVDHENVVSSAFRLSKNQCGWVISSIKGIDGNVLLGSTKGIFSYNKVKDIYKQITKQPGYLLTQTAGGLIYFLIADKKMQVYDPRTKVTKPFADYVKNTGMKYPAFTASYLLEDHTGTLWIGTEEKGMLAFNPRTQTLKSYPYISNNNRIKGSDVLDDKRVIMIYEDHEGTVWAGTNNGGLNRYDRKRDTFVSSYRPQEQFNCIQAIFEDEKHRLWAGSYLMGLFMVDKITGFPLKHFTEKEGLISNNVGRIGIQNGQYLWVWSPRGFSRLNLDDFSIRSFPVANAPWQDLFANSQASLATLIDNQSGTVIVPGNNKLVTVDLKHMPVNKTSPIVHIETISHNDPRAQRSADSTDQAYGIKELQLPHNQNRITFTYVALDFNDAPGIRYQYKLDGYDGSWLDAGTTRWVTYTNLSPGTYTFRVKAKNSDGFWNNKGDTFIVTINAPWWQTWWAWLLWIILFVSIIYAFTAYRSRKLMHDKRILERKVQIRTEEVMQQKEEIEAQRDSLEETLNELKLTQTQLIQSEKMASLGELTAGIAHEIQNPLNFVNNFSEVNMEMLVELREELDKGGIEEAKSVAADIEQNEIKINHHGKRADAIVKGMLEHSRAGTGKKQVTDLNVLADEYLRLAYHGLRAKNKEFNADLVTNFDAKLPAINVVPQDICRVMLNLFNNAFYAVNEKKKRAADDYKPEVTISTASTAHEIEIRVKDNGNGITDAIKDKIMQPFFTTKPTGEGTGLGLSLSYDIVVKGHNGTITVNSRENEYTEFVIVLPLETA